MMPREDIFEAACQKEFSFLAGLGFKIVSTEKDNYGCRITYKNNTTAIKINLGRDLMFIDCYKLKNGEIPKPPIFFNPTDEFLVFDINDLLAIRTGDQIGQDHRLMYKEKYLADKVKEFAEKLKCYGMDILSGDFSLLPEIKKRVIRRAKELENEQRS